MTHYFLCHNPLADFPEDITGYIYHEGKPRFFAFIRAYDFAKPYKPVKEQGMNVAFFYRRPGGKPQLFL